MKWMAGALALLAAQSAERSFDYSVIMDGRSAGTAQITVRELPEGRRQVLLTMDLRIGGSASRVRQETIYEADGAASRKIQETSSAGKRRLLVAELSAQGAKLTTTEDGKASTVNVPLSAQAPRSNPSTFWFERSQPKAGARVSYYAFDLSDREWRLETTTFVGRRSFEHRGQAVQANRVTTSRGGREVVNWVDDQGMPIALIQGDAMRIERTR